jgi:hypothetical protein
MTGSHARLFVLGPSLVMCALACTTTKGSTPDEPRSTPAPAATVGISPVPAPTSLQENALETSDEGPAAPPPVGLAMGAACKRDDAVHCGTRDRISVELQMHNLPPRKKKDVPCEMVLLPHADYAANVAMGCVKDERVYLAGECPMCRMSSRWELTGLVAEMTDAQLVQAQRRLAFAPEPLLRTPDAWRSAIASAASRPAPARKR